MRNPVRFTLLLCLAILGTVGPAAAEDLVAPKAGVTARTAVAAEPVGQITLCIGVGHVLRAGQTVLVVKGAPVYVGDRIETSANGHVHVRFVDQARVSVRPDSVLDIQEYHFDPQQPENNAIRFELLQGVARAVSGEAAHQARERFRLNTPLVAIGVRGTDFTTRTSGTSTSVVVNQGAIVLSPLGAGCAAAALGPCGGPRARLLSASMSGTALVYRVNMNEPSFQPLNSLRGGDRITPTLQQEQQSAAPSTGVVADSRAPGTMARFLPQQANLIWGRWTSTTLPGDTLTVPFDQALRGNALMLGDGYYFLFRNEQGTDFLANARGPVQFTLQSSAANFRPVPTGPLSAATVQSGTLGIDFTQDTFSTQLILNAPGIASQTLNVNGTVNPVNGLFSVNTSQNRLSGVVSIDTLQAGYLFYKPLPNGAALTGATLWSR